jgi:hypothetical protein
MCSWGLSFCRPYRLRKPFRVAPRPVAFRWSGSNVLSGEPMLGHSRCAPLQGRTSTGFRRPRSHSVQSLMGATLRGFHLTSRPYRARPTSDVPASQAPSSTELERTAPKVKSKNREIDADKAFGQGRSDQLSGIASGRAHFGTVVGW